MTASNAEPETPQRLMLQVKLDTDTYEIDLLGLTIGETLWFNKAADHSYGDLKANFAALIYDTSVVVALATVAMARVHGQPLGETWDELQARELRSLSLDLPPAEAEPDPTEPGEASPEVAASPEAETSKPKRKRKPATPGSPQT